MFILTKYMYNETILEHVSYDLTSINDSEISVYVEKKTSSLSSELRFFVYLYLRNFIRLNFCFVLNKYDILLENHLMVVFKMLFTQVATFKMT